MYPCGSCSDVYETQLEVEWHRHECQYYQMDLVEMKLDAEDYELWRIQSNLFNGLRK
ncbi:hypothetical protein LCGC14_1326180 [marine sediment metagenome]|uniref:Uncharacterized protein n=1 Tax=marine sediment metagenome TaxID=412755 RepID=A0A0F9NKF8_9ZZZZ